MMFAIQRKKWFQGKIVVLAKRKLFLNEYGICGYCSVKSRYTGTTFHDEK